MEKSNENADPIVKDPEKTNESTVNTLENTNQIQEETKESTLSKRQLKKIKKREKWLKLKPEKRYYKNV